MTEDAAPQPVRYVEVDMAELKELIDKDPDVKKKLDGITNRFDRSHAAYDVRQLRQEVYQHRQLNRQQHDIMRGFLKGQGTMNQMTYNLALGLSVALGGIDATVKSLREKSWWDKNGATIIVLGFVGAIYFGFLYSADFRLWITNLFEPVSTRVILAFTIVIILYLWWRSRRRRQGPQP